MAVDEERLKQIRQPVGLVLSYDLEKLRRDDQVKRAALWNSVKSNESLFENGWVSGLSPEDKTKIASEFTLAKLLLAAAAQANGERSPIIKRFNAAELELVANFERFNVFDILSVEEIADRMARRKDIYDLAIGFYRNEYARLDSLLESPDIQKDLKLAFNKRYRGRLNRVAEGVQAYIAKYGVTDFVGQVEDRLRSTTDTAPEMASVRRGEPSVPATAGGTTPPSKPAKRRHWRPEWVGLVISLIAVFSYLGGFQLWPWLQSRQAASQEYALIVQPVPGDLGAVQVSPLSESNGKYRAGTRVTLYAREANGARFVRWSGDAQGTITTVVLTMDHDKQVFAEFEILQTPVP